MVRSSPAYETIAVLTVIFTCDFPVFRPHTGKCADCYKILVNFIIIHDTRKQSDSYRTAPLTNDDGYMKFVHRNIIIIIYLLRPWAAHKTYKDKKLKTTGTHTNKKR